MLSEIQKLFLGDAPSWYKSTIIGFLIFNPILLIILNISIPENSGLDYPSSVYFHISYGFKMLPASTWWTFSN